MAVAITGSPKVLPIPVSIGRLQDALAPVREGGPAEGGETA